VKFRRILIKEETHPQDLSRIYLVQIAVDDQPCVPFWSHEIERRRLGEENWWRSLCENAAGLIAQYGPQPALT
jgi:hypothetical protein